MWSLLYLTIVIAAISIISRANTFKQCFGLVYLLIVISFLTSNSPLIGTNVSDMSVYNKNPKSLKTQTFEKTLKKNSTVRLDFLRKIRFRYSQG